MAVEIKDLGGGKVKLAQWECDRVLLISGTTDMPICRFASPLLTHALPVNGEASGDNWTVKFPNVLLQYDGMVFLSVVVENSADEVEEIATAKLFVQPRQKPLDYEYTDNIGYVNWVTLSAEAQDVIDSLLYQKEHGDFDGDDGYSPTVAVSNITGGHRITVTDKNGDHTVDVMDGAPGTPGSPGSPGDDGYSPVVTITDIEGGHRVTITDETHPTGQSFDVMDGQGGGGGGTVTVDDALSDSSTNPVQNKVIKAALDGKGTYSKPSGGIPKTDLASAVQTSLGKADTALQSYTETDPTVPSWAKASSKPSYTASEVGAIAAPSSPASGAFLVWDGSAWIAQTLAAWQASSY